MLVTTTHVVYVRHKAAEGAFEIADLANDAQPGEVHLKSLLAQAEANQKKPALIMNRAPSESLRALLEEHGVLWQLVEG